MKRHLLLSAFVVAALPTLAQLPDGSTAPDWTATDINGVEHNLQSYLDQGKTVIIDFSATWVGPSWNYQNTGILADLYNTFGPTGTNDLMVFLLEGDDTTTQADLEGTGTATVGDFVTGTPYPIIDNAGSIFDDYAGAYYPTIYTICPDGILVESGQASFEQHISMAFGNCENTITGPAPLMSYNGDTMACGGGTWSASVEVINLGDQSVTSMFFYAGLSQASVEVEWTGDIGAGMTETINLASFYEVGELTVNLASVNNGGWWSTTNATIVGSEESTTYVQVRITTDNWPEETGWVIADDAGNEVASAAVGSLAGSADTPFTWDVGLPSTGCYTFTMFDAYGDGLYASQWGNYTDGTAGVYTLFGNTEVALWEYDGATGVEFAEISAGIQAIEVFSLDGCTDPQACNYWPSAENDDGSCEYESCAGCTEPEACNYDDLATLDDGSCDYSCYGCTDPGAWNYDAAVVFDDGSCIYFIPSCEFLGADEWSGLNAGLFAGLDPVVHEFGVQDEGSFVLSVPFTVSEPTTGTQFGALSWSNLTWSGLPNGFVQNELPSALSAGNQVCLTYEGIPYEEGEFEVTAVGDLVLSVFGQPYVIANYSSHFVLTVVPNASGIMGCTYPNATNFLIYATVDDGSCSYGGCMDPEADNFQVYALTEDGSCVYGECNAICPSDLDGDGAIGTGDLLMVLASFGMVCL